MTMPPYDPYKLLYRHTIGTTCLMRRELVTAVGGFDADFGGYEDWEFWLHALQKGWHGRRVEEITFEYRRHGSTKLTADRLEYRRWFKRLRASTWTSTPAAASWPASPTSRPWAAWSTGGGWGARPMPARFEHWLHSLLWGVARWRSCTAQGPSSLRLIGRVTRLRRDQESLHPLASPPAPGRSESPGKRSYRLSFHINALRSATRYRCSSRIPPAHGRP